MSLDHRFISVSPYTRTSNIHVQEIFVNFTEFLRFLLENFSTHELPEVENRENLQSKNFPELQYGPTC